MYIPFHLLHSGNLRLICRAITFLKRLSIQQTVSTHINNYMYATIIQYLNTVFPQLCRNAATIRGRLLFEVQTPRLLFISALPQCGDYSKAATIRSTDAAATIYFSSVAMRRLFEGGYYSKYRHRGYYLFQRYRNAATIRGRLLFEVQTSRLLFISALPQCRRLFEGGYYSKYRRTAATIYFSSTAMRRLFEGGYYSKYRRRGYYLFQLYRNAATIRGRLLFEVQTSRLLFISALPQCGDYSRVARGYYLFQLYRNVATIRGRLLFEVRRLFEKIR